MNEKWNLGQEIEIDEENLKPLPTTIQRLKSALLAVAMGIVLVQMFFFTTTTYYGNFTPASVVIFFYFHNIYSLIFFIYLAICAVLGWIKGQRFIDWINYKISFLKFW